MEHKEKMKAEQSDGRGAAPGARATPSCTMHQNYLGLITQSRNCAMAT